MKDYAQIKKNKHEGLVDFENIPNKVSMAHQNKNQDKDD